jgi:hypothetical protein
LAVGSNGETLVADSSTSTGLRYQAPVAQNPILNSAFQVWQRGTSFSLAASSAVTYTADRWSVPTGANQACTISRQATGDTTNLPNIQYALRFQRNSGQTGTGGLYLQQNFETVNTIPFAGKTVTMSFYARAGANFSATSNALRTYLVTGTGTDQNWLTSGYTGSGLAIDGTATLTTTWQRFTFTGTIPAATTEISVSTFFTPTGTASTNDYYEVTGFQLEVGSVATQFKTFSATLQGELAACQRYYYRTNGGANLRFGTGQAIATTLANCLVPFPVQMRIAPTALEQSGTAANYGVLNASASSVLTGGVVPTFDKAGLINANVTFTVTSGLVAGNAAQCMDNNSSSAYLGWSAEL